MRQFMGRIGIRWKMAIAASLVAIAATATVSCYLTLENIALVRQETVGRVKSVVDYAAARLQYPTFLDDPHLVKNCLEEIADTHPSLVFIEVSNSEGEPLGSAGRSQLAKSVAVNRRAADVPGEKTAGQGGPIVRSARIPEAGISGHYATAPVTLVSVQNDQEDPFGDVVSTGPDTIVLGQVRLFISDSETRATIARVRLLAIVIATALALITALVSYALARTLVRPIHDLVRGTRRVAEGDLDVVLRVETDDEFGLLSRSFNKMASDLKVSYDRLNEYSTRLEHKVAERTQQIEQANRELEAQRAALEESNRQLSLINRIAEEVNRSLDLRETLQAALAQILDAAGAKAGGIYIWDAAQNRIRLEAWSGVSRRSADRVLDLTAQHPFTRRCVSTDELVLAADAEPSAAPLLALAREIEGIEQLWVVPLRSGGSTMGLVTLAFGEPKPLTAAHVDFVVALSRPISSAIANARLFEQTRVQADALEKANREMAEVNARLVEANEELRSANDTITAQQQSLVRAAKMASMGTLAAGIAHEINNPLAIIAGYSEALLDKIAAVEIHDRGPLGRLPRYLEVINSECFRCKDITQGLLTLAREGELARTVGNINDSITETLTLLNFHREHDAHSVVLNLDPAVPDIACDPNQLQQVFLNLALNALDAMGPSRKLHVTTAVEGDWIRVEFRDEGSGIRPDVLERIFDPFFTTKPEGTGTGLGLAMCQAIVEQHEGTIEVESVVDEGTTFTIRLPIKEPPAAGEALSPDASGRAAA
jgi:signal transduction histidine kinase